MYRFEMLLKVALITITLTIIYKLWWFLTCKNIMTIKLVKWFILIDHLYCRIWFNHFRFYSERGSNSRYITLEVSTVTITPTRWFPASMCHYMIMMIFFFQWKMSNCNVHETRLYLIYMNLQISFLDLHARGDCWYWWNWWPSLFKISFYII